MDFKLENVFETIVNPIGLRWDTFAKKLFKNLKALINYHPIAVVMSITTKNKKKLQVRLQILPGW